MTSPAGPWRTSAGDARSRQFTVPKICSLLRKLACPRFAPHTPRHKDSCLDSWDQSGDKCSENVYPSERLYVGRSRRHCVLRTGPLYIIHGAVCMNQTRILMDAQVPRAGIQGATIASP
jgi:hypothetical protein